MFNKLKEAIALAEEKEFEEKSLDIILGESAFDDDIELLISEDINTLNEMEAVLIESNKHKITPEMAEKYGAAENIKYNKSLEKLVDKYENGKITRNEFTRQKEALMQTRNNNQLYLEKNANKNARNIGSPNRADIDGVDMKYTDKQKETFKKASEISTRFEDRRPDRKLEMERRLAANKRRLETKKDIEASSLANLYNSNSPEAPKSETPKPESVNINSFKKTPDAEPLTMYKFDSDNKSEQPEKPKVEVKPQEAPKVEVKPQEAPKVEVKKELAPVTKSQEKKAEVVETKQSLKDKLGQWYNKNKKAVHVGGAIAGAAALAGAGAYLYHRNKKKKAAEKEKEKQLKESYIDVYYNEDTVYVLEEDMDLLMEASDYLLDEDALLEALIDEAFVLDRGKKSGGKVTAGFKNLSLKADENGADDELNGNKVKVDKDRFTMDTGKGKATMSQKSAFRISDEAEKEGSKNKVFVVKKGNNKKELAPITKSQEKNNDDSKKAELVENKEGLKAKLGHWYNKNKKAVHVGGAIAGAAALAGAGAYMYSKHKKKKAAEKEKEKQLKESYIDVYYNEDSIFILEEDMDLLMEASDYLLDEYTLLEALIIEASKNPSADEMAEDIEEDEELADILESVVQDF